MLVVHQYPQTGKAAEAVALVRHNASYKSAILLGETSSLWADEPTQRAFLLAANRYLIGAFGFFDGRDPNHMTVKTIPDALYQAGLRGFMALRARC